MSVYELGPTNHAERLAPVKRTYASLDGSPEVRTTPELLDLYDGLKIVSPADIAQSTLGTQYKKHINTLKDSHRLASNSSLRVKQNDVERARNILKLMPPEQVRWVRWKGDRTGDRMVVPPSFLREYMVYFVHTPAASQLVAMLDEDYPRVEAAEALAERMKKDALVSQQRITELEAETKRQTELAEARKQSEVDVISERLEQLRNAELAAEEDMCLAQLRVLFNRIKAQWLTREQFAAMYLGQYREVVEHFAGHKSVSTSAIVSWLRDHPTGKRFWRALSARIGLLDAPFDTNLLQIEHIQNAAWGGADHPLNYMILFASVNNSVEFRTGPCHLKMIMIGRRNFEFVQRFARWHIKSGSASPRNLFLTTERKHSMLTILFMPRQATLPMICGKRERE